MTVLPVRRDWGTKVGLCLSSKHKIFAYNLYTVGPTSSTLAQHCINVIQNVRVCWIRDHLALIRHNQSYMHIALLEPLLVVKRRFWFRGLVRPRKQNVSSPSTREIRIFWEVSVRESQTAKSQIWTKRQSLLISPAYSWGSPNPVLSVRLCSQKWSQTPFT